MRAMRHKKVLDLPCGLHAHIADLDLSYRRYHLQPMAIDHAIERIAVVVARGGRQPKAMSVTADMNGRIADLAKRHATQQWKIVSALLLLAAFDPLCPSSTNRSPQLPQPPSGEPLG